MFDQDVDYPLIVVAILSLLIFFTGTYVAKKVVTRAIPIILYNSSDGKASANGNSRKRKNWAVVTQAIMKPTIVPRIRDATITAYCSYI